MEDASTGKKALSIALSGAMAFGMVPAAALMSMDAPEVAWAEEGEQENTDEQSKVVVTIQKANLTDSATGKRASELYDEYVVTYRDDMVVGNGANTITYTPITVNASGVKQHTNAEGVVKPWVGFCLVPLTLDDSVKQYKNAYKQVNGKTADVSDAPSLMSTNAQSLEHNVTEYINQKSEWNDGFVA